MGNPCVIRTVRAFAALAAAAVLPPVAATPAAARPLNRAIPELFGGTLATTIDPSVQQDSHDVLVAERFRGLSAAVAAARSQAPIPSASGAFRFAWDSELDTFVRYEQNLGSGLAERAQTLGRNTFTLGLSYTRIDFDTLDGDRLSRLRSMQPALSKEFLAPLSEEDRQAFGDDVLETEVDLAFSFDLFYLTAAYGITDTVDVSLALSINRARMRANAIAKITDSDGVGDAFFFAEQQGLTIDDTISGCEEPRCALDGFDDSAVGTGDLFLRSKWHFANTVLADLAVAGVLTLPTGNADDFLGFHDVTFTPWLIASKDIGRVSPHLNLGYALRSGKDVSQGQWIAGADVRATSWLTLGADVIGYHDDTRDGINDDVIQSALGFKLNPYGQVIIAGTFQLPLNRDGPRADVTYTTQIEYTFW